MIDARSAIWNALECGALMTLQEVAAEALMPVATVRRLIEELKDDRYARVYSDKLPKGCELYRRVDVATKNREINNVLRDIGVVKWRAERAKEPVRDNCFSALELAFRMKLPETGNR